MFGEGTWNRPWLQGPIDRKTRRSARRCRLRLSHPLGTPYFAFHDVDATASSNSLKEHVENLKHIEGYFAKKMEETKVKLLWGTRQSVRQQAFRFRRLDQP